MVLVLYLCETCGCVFGCVRHVGVVLLSYMLEEPGDRWCMHNYVTVVFLCADLSINLGRRFTQPSRTPSIMNSAKNWPVKW